MSAGRMMRGTTGAGPGGHALAHTRTSQCEAWDCQPMPELTREVRQAVEQLIDGNRTAAAGTVRNWLGLPALPVRGEVVVMGGGRVTISVDRQDEASSYPAVGTWVTLVEEEP